MSRAFPDLHVAVLMGGLSSEREVSLVSGAGCADALERLGARVSRVDAGRDLAAGAGRAEARRRASTPCTATGARTAASRACWRPWPSPTPTPACWPRRWPWTRPRPRRCWRRRASSCPAAGCSTAHEVAARPRHAAALCGQAQRRGLVGRRVPGLRGRQRPAAARSAADAGPIGEQVMVEPYIPGKELAVAVGDERPARPDGHRHRARPRASMTTRPSTARAAPSTSCRPNLPPHVFETAHATWPSWRTPRLVAAALPDPTSVMTTLRTFLVLLEVNTQPGMTPDLARSRAGRPCRDGVSTHLVLWITEDASCPR